MNNLLLPTKEKILPGAEPISYEKSESVGCLLLHGFTATPQALKGLASGLERAGISHYAPLLLGHGTKVRDLNKISWQQQEQFVEKIFKELQRKHKKIFVIGESSGGALALRLAAKYPQQVQGVSTVCGAIRYPGHKFLKVAIPVYRRVVPYPRKIRVADIKDRSAIKERVAYKNVPLQAFWHLMKYSREVERDLPKIKSPLLVLQTLNDHAVAPESADIIYSLVGSSQKKLIWYPESYHILLVDYEKEKAFKDILDFVKKHS